MKVAAFFSAQSLKEDSKQELKTVGTELKFNFS